MLVLTRKISQCVFIGDDIKVTVVDVKGGQVRLGIDAPRCYRIFREEIYNQIKEENKRAAASVDSGSNLNELVNRWDQRTGKGDLSKISSRGRPEKDDAGET